MKIPARHVLAPGGNALQFEVEIPRAFWRYLFAGLALRDSSAHMEGTTFEDDARDAVNRADGLLAELEKGAGK